MSKYNKIYVVAPYNHATGGVELSHQLVDYLRNKNEEAYIVYFKKGYVLEKEHLNVTPAYSKYNIKVATEIEDNEKNILVLPEIFFELISDYNEINIGCWWMSVDNRYNYVNFKELLRHRKGIILKLKTIYVHLFRGMYKEKNSNVLLRENDNRITHLCQSQYAFQHVKEQGFSNIEFLSDYINAAFIDTKLDNKKDIILYNPLKGYAFTKKIIDKMPDYQFVALKGFSREELVSILGSAKLYIDFGHFPGKDRLPREAVVNGCCIITGKNGASKYFEDIPIPNSYKFESNKDNITAIVDRIKYVISNYDTCKSDFESYRTIVFEEKEKFFKEIDKVFGLSA